MDESAIKSDRWIDFFSNLFSAWLILGTTWFGFIDLLIKTIWAKYNNIKYMN